MGFFFAESKSSKPAAKQSKSRHIPIESMRKLGCAACPRASDKTPAKLPPLGPDNSLIYVLGDSPSEGDAERADWFNGEVGRRLRKAIGSKVWNNEVRAGAVTRCVMPSGREPELSELECCRNQVVEDIERTRPLVIVGAGNTPLNWATGISNGVTNWRGRIIATKIGNHPCWYYPILSPAYVDQKKGKYGKSEFEKVFEYDLNQLLDNFPEEPPVVYEAPYDQNITYITGNRGHEDLVRLEEHLHRLILLPETAIDYETNGLRPHKLAEPRIHLVSVGTYEDTLAFTLDHPEGWSDTHRKKAWGAFGDYLLYSNRKIAHNLAFEMEWTCYFFGPEILRKTEWEDTMAMSHTLYETKGTHSLDVVIREHLGFFLKDQSPVDLKTRQITDYPLDVAMRYNALDTKWTHKVKQSLSSRIKQDPKYVYEYERKVRLAPTLVITQDRGVPVDFEYAEEMGKTLDAEVLSIEKKIFATTEVKRYEQQFGKFEPTSPDHVLKLMRDICKRDEVKKDGGGYTTDEDALSSIPERSVPSAPLILEHRGAIKMRSTYIDPVLTRAIVGKDGRMHPVFNSMVAVTGRLASEDPNAQNYPKRKRREIRGIVAAPEGFILNANDYGQIEARVFAMASEDPNLVKYLWSGYDIHGFWADEFMRFDGKIKDRIIKDYKVDGDDSKGIRKKFRDEIKNGWVFPQFFGSSINSCANNLKVGEDLATRLGKQFWDEFKGVAKWQEKVLKYYDKHLCVETLLGRKRRGAMTKNEIINMPIQGTAADIVTEAMNALSEMAIIEDWYDLIANLNVHDDLTFMLPEQEHLRAIDVIATEMCRHRFDFINVPLIVESQTGYRWHELKEIKVYRSDELFNLRNPYA